MTEIPSLKREFFCSVNIKGNRAKKLLDLIHLDVCGPFQTLARGDYQYFITFIDDYSRLVQVYLMHHKSKTFVNLKSSKH